MQNKEPYPYFPDLSSEPFTKDSNPASDIRELIDYLSRTDDGSYVYRGQTRAYSGPLLPSAFRGVLGHEPVVEGDHPLKGHRILGIGQRFLGNYILDMEEYHQRVYEAIFHGTPRGRLQPEKRRDADAYRDSHFTRVGDKWVETIRANPLDLVVEASWLTGEFNTLATSKGYEAAVRAIIERYSPPAASIPKAIQQVADYVNDRHRRRFSTDILVGAFSYVLGSTISQQYGFSSAFLDATTSIEIAAFFATHEAPQYGLVRADGRRKVGVIYRIPRGASRCSAVDATSDAYGSQGTIVLPEILRDFEADVTQAESLRSLRTCFEARYLPGYWERRYDFLKFPLGSVSSSRIGHQQAAVVIPDQIEVLLENAYITSSMGVIEHPNNRIQMSIEDLNSRKGMKCYYFLHTNTDPCPRITPSYLWPNEDDFFLLALAYLFAGGFGCYMPNSPFVCPVRPDLIDPGYGRIDHDRILSEAKEVLSEENHQSSIYAPAPWLRSESARQVYRIYKAATLLFEGNMAGERSCLESALSLCRQAREQHPSSPTLVALELIALKDIGYRQEFERIVPVCEQAVAREFGESAHSVALERYNQLCGAQGHPRFAVELINWYRADLSALV